MANQQAKDTLNLWRKHWVLYSIIADVLLSTALAVGVAVVCYACLAHWFLWTMLCFALTLALLLYLHKPWAYTSWALSGYLNQLYPELEESCELLLKPQPELNILEGLQQTKVAQVVTSLSEPSSFTRRLKFAALWLLVALLFSFLITRVGYNWLTAAKINIFTSPHAQPATSPRENILPQISSVSVRIIPPAYTKIPASTASVFTLNTVEGAEVHWSIQTSQSVSSLQFVFNDKELVSAAPDKDQRVWTLSKQINQSGFYQVKVGGKLSDYYQISVLKDSPPVINIKAPKQYTYIDAGEAARVQVNASVNDDYGVSDAFIYATVAKGSGEAVKFKEQKLSFSTSFAGQQQRYELSKNIDLHSLDMEPGDELYFYIEATDNHSQSSRTDVYIVSIQDTAQLLSMNGMALGVSPVPEYFRSERQIILDSEKLLKDKDSISIEVFNTRSNDLGIDQKLLRLRYGKFLGEEAESGEGASAGRDELSSPADFSNATKILDTYSDKHDNAEDAGFFEKDTKEQLKATLTQMWGAELRLRIFKPADALPFEYKALRMLKDLQQKSRAYVAKTAYNPPTLKVAEKRLSGDLSKIAQPAFRHDMKTDDRYALMKKAVAELEQLKEHGAFNGQAALQQAAAQLGALAVNQPERYLAGVAALRRILAAGSTKAISPADVLLAEAALQKALPVAVNLPQTNQVPNDMGLATQYFKNLSH